MDITDMEIKGTFDTFKSHQHYLYIFIGELVANYRNEPSHGIVLLFASGRLTNIKFQIEAI